MRSSRAFSGSCFLGSSSPSGLDGFNQASTIGKVGIFASLGVAFLVGISATLINFFYNAGA